MQHFVAEVALAVRIHVRKAYGDAVIVEAGDNTTGINAATERFSAIGDQDDTDGLAHGQPSFGVKHQAVEADVLGFPFDDDAISQADFGFGVDGDSAAFTVFGASNHFCTSGTRGLLPAMFEKGVGRGEWAVLRSGPCRRGTLASLLPARFSACQRPCFFALSVLAFRLAQIADPR